MGIYDRDYYRDSSRGFLEAWGRQGVTVWLIVITCAVWFAQLVTRDAFGPGSGVTEFGKYDTDRLLRGEVWRLFTPIFLHSERDLLHIAFNMLVLYFAGSRLEERYGGREFLLFYLAGGVFANAAYLLVQVAGLMPASTALGASGAVTAVLVVYAFHWPHQQVLLFFVIPMPAWLLIVILIGLNTLGVFGAGERGIGYAVHLAGALFGAVYYTAGWRLAGLIPGGPARPRPAPAPRLRVVPPADPADRDEPAEPVAAALETPPRPAAGADEQFEAKVDRVLAKVSKYGQESLTPEEREILFRASEIYKKRRK